MLIFPQKNIEVRHCFNFFKKKKILGKEIFWEFNKIIARKNSTRLLFPQKKKHLFS